MAKYKCNVCGYVFDEEEQRIPFSELKECPVCHQPASAFSIYEEIRQVKREEKKEESLEYPREFSREDESCRYMKEIHEMAVTGKSIHAAMGTRLPMPSWDDILILGAQLDPMPLEACRGGNNYCDRKACEEASDPGKSCVYFSYVFRRPVKRGEDRPGKGICPG